MMDRIRDIPIAGGLAAGLTDLLVFGGETFVVAFLIVLESIDLWIPMLSYTTRLAEHFTWLPEEPVETLLLGAMVLFVLYYGFRIVRRLISGSTQENET